jgi:hypothetical protein
VQVVGSQHDCFALCHQSLKNIDDRHYDTFRFAISGTKNPTIPAVGMRKPVALAARRALHPQHSGGMNARCLSGARSARPEDREEAGDLASLVGERYSCGTAPDSHRLRFSARPSGVRAPLPGYI